MSCLVPGHVIVAPNRSIDQTIGIMSEYARQKIEIAYSIQDVLSHYHLDKEVEDMIERAGPLPFIARVPEGEETRLASEFGSVPGISCSIPYFYIRPSAIAPHFNISIFEFNGITIILFII